MSDFEPLVNSKRRDILHRVIYLSLINYRLKLTNYNDAGRAGTDTVNDDAFYAGDLFWRWWRIEGDDDVDDDNDEAISV